MKIVGIVLASLIGFVLLIYCVGWSTFRQDQAEAKATVTQSAGTCATCKHIQAENVRLLELNAELKALAESAVSDYREYRRLNSLAKPAK